MLLKLNAVLAVLCYIILKGDFAILLSKYWKTYSLSNVKIPGLLIVIYLLQYQKH